MQQRKLASIVGLGLLLGLGLLWWLREQAASSALLIQTAETDRPTESVTAHPTDEKPKPPPTRSSMPPAGTPLVSMFDMLKRRADQGDALAACRLAVELIECRDVEILLANSAHLQPESDEPEIANSLDHMQLKQLQAAQRCEGIDAAKRALAGTYLALAANAGINEAMIRYADGQGFSQSDKIYGLLRDPGFDAWRHDAVKLTHRALRQGEPSAVLLLMVAHSDDNALFAGLVADDPVQYFSYRLLIERLRGRNEVPKNALSPFQLAQAEANAVRMHHDHFAGRTLTQPDAFRGALSRNWARTDTDPPRTPCE